MLSNIRSYMWHWMCQVNLEEQRSQTMKVKWNDEVNIYFEITLKSCELTVTGSLNHFDSFYNK